MNVGKKIEETQDEEVVAKYKKYTTTEATKTAHRLRKCREDKKISRAVLELKCINKEMPASSFSIINYEQPVTENGKRHNVMGMKLSTFYELCEYYKVSADYLLGFKTSKQREASADYVNKEFGLDDEILEFLQKLKSHEVLILSPTYYKDYSETALFSLFIKRFICDIEPNIVNYFNAAAALEEYEEKNIDHKTGILKRGYEEYEECNVEIDPLELNAEEEIIENYQRLKLEFEVEEIKIYRGVVNFLTEVKKELKKEKE